MRNSDNGKKNSGLIRVLEILAVVAVFGFLGFRIGPSIIAKIRGTDSFPTDVTKYTKDINLSEDELYLKFVNSILSGENSVNVGITSQDTIDKVIYRVYDTPELFWIDNRYQITTVASYYVVNFFNVYDDIDTKKAAIDKAVSGIMKDLPKGCDFDKVLYLHDAICNMAEYDDSASNIHNIYGVFVDGKAVCEGYAKAFSYLLSEAGIENYIFSGDANNSITNGSHAWNAAMLDGELYYFDLTWDDSEDYGISYDYFAVTSADINKNHYFDEYHPIMYTDATENNYYIKKGLVLDEYSRENAAEMIASQGKDAFIKCRSIVTYQNLLSAIKNPYQFNEILTLSGVEKGDHASYIANDNMMTIRIIL